MYLTFTQDTESEAFIFGDPIGTNSGSCTIVGFPTTEEQEQGIILYTHCLATQTYSILEGTLVTAGEYPVGTTNNRAIIGGTGIFSKARGSCSLGPANGGGGPWTKAPYATSCNVE